MLSFKKYLMVSIFLCVADVDAMNLGHIIDAHVFNEKINYKDVIKNVDNGILSVLKSKNSDQRKTLFPENMTKESIEKELAYMYQNGQVLAETKTIKYIHHPTRNLVVGMACNELGQIVTAFPVLRYVSLDEMQGKDDKESIYIAHSKDKTKNKAVKVSVAVKDIKEMALHGTYIAKNKIYFNEEVIVTDVSEFFTKLLYYGVENKRGSILVETKWLNGKSL